MTNEIVVTHLPSHPREAHHPEGTRYIKFPDDGNFVGPIAPVFPKDRFEKGQLVEFPDGWVGALAGFYPKVRRVVQ